MDEELANVIANLTVRIENLEKIRRTDDAAITAQEDYKNHAQTSHERSIVNQLVTEGYSDSQIPIFIARMKKGEKPWLDTTATQTTGPTSPLTKQSLADLQQEKQIITQLQMEGLTLAEAIIYFQRMEKGEKPWLDPPGFQVDGKTPIVK